VEPMRYGGPASMQGTLHDPERDATTLPLIRAALEAGVPVLAICRGIQELNVALGGSLHQRVEELPGKLDHRADDARPVEEQYAKVHSVSLTPGGLLERITGHREIRVNSIHAQAIDRLADGLTVEAVAPDGLIEAVSVTGAPAFALAVQWHPEWRFRECPDSTALFQAFGRACADHAAVLAAKQAAR
jgi:putative glutamine amidotransferase